MLYSTYLDHGQDQVHGTGGPARETRTEWISRALGAMSQEGRRGPSDLTSSGGHHQELARPAPGQRREENPSALRLVHQLLTHTLSPVEGLCSRAPSVTPSPHSTRSPRPQTASGAPPLPRGIAPVSLLRTVWWQDNISFSWRSCGQPPDCTPPECQQH